MEDCKIAASLEVLDVGGNRIGDAGVQDLAVEFKFNTTLNGLNLYDNMIGDPGAKDLAVVLKVNITLTTRYLGINIFGDPRLVVLLKVNTILTTLDLDNNVICDLEPKTWQQDSKSTLPSHYSTSVTTILVILQPKTLQQKANTALKILKLCSNSIGDPEAKDLVTALKVNTTPTRFNSKNL